MSIKYVTFVALLLLAAIGNAQVPSDMLTWHGPNQVLSLSGVNPEAAKAIDATNEGLGNWVVWDIPNYGKLTTTAILADQDKEAPVGVPSKLLNFSDAIVNLPESI